MKQSRAAVQVGVRQIEIQSFPVPEKLPPGFGLIRIEASGMCGTDVSQYSGATQALGMYTYPAVLGHEAIGYIEALTEEGARHWNVKVGDRVAVEPAAPCDRCGKCTTNRSALCGTRFVYSFKSSNDAPSLWGAYSEYMLLHPQSHIHVVPSDIPIAEATLFNALAGGYTWAVQSAGTQAGDDVVIIGPGLRGLAGVMAAQEAGARNIIVVGRGDGRKAEIARLYGATHVLDSTRDDIVPVIKEITGGGAQRFIDFTPHADWALGASVAAAELGATIVIVGIKGKPVSLESDQVMHKAITIKGVNGPGAWGYRQAMDTIISGRRPLDVLHTHTFHFTEAETAIRTLAGEVEGEKSLEIIVTA